MKPVSAFTPLNSSLIHRRVKHLLPEMVRITRTSVFPAKHPVLRLRESRLLSLRHQSLEKQIGDVERVFAGLGFRVG
jgi:hypothetical protein